MSENQSSYRQIVKASSILGGAQVITIIIGFVRTKLIAVLLGASGVGLFGLFNAPLGFITSLTSLGINYSAVRNIAEAAGEKDEIKIANTLKVVRKWVLFTGILGAIVTLAFSQTLSMWTFGNSNYTLTFALLSVTLFVNAINGGQKTLLQGLRKLKDLAKTTILGSLLGLISSVPLYYYWGLEGIPFAIIITAVTNLAVSSFFASKVSVSKSSPISILEIFHRGSSMVKLGIVLSVSSVIGMGIRYIINAYIGREGSIEQVGLYQAGFGLISTYVGMVFNAMGSDYYPRLTAINKDNKKCIEVINHQIIVSVTVLAPFCALLLNFFPLIIRIVYSKEFLEVVPMGHWLVLSIFVKSIVWALGYLYLAKGALKVAFVIDNLINIIFLVGYIGLYELFGLEGIGIADLCMYLLALPLSFLVAWKMYGFNFSKEAVFQFLKYGFLLVILFCLVKYTVGMILYLSGSFLTLVIIYLSFLDLNKQIGLVEYLKRKFLNGK